MELKPLINLYNQHNGRWMVWDILGISPLLTAAMGMGGGQRYKCLGNAVTTNVVKEIVRRLFNLREDNQGEL